MKRYRCKWCGYDNYKSDKLPSLCPYCNKSDCMEECFNPDKIVKEVDDI